MQVSWDSTIMGYCNHKVSSSCLNTTSQHYCLHTTYSCHQSTPPPMPPINTPPHHSQQHPHHPGHPPNSPTTRAPMISPPPPPSPWGPPFPSPPHPAHGQTGFTPPPPPMGCMVSMAYTTMVYTTPRMTYSRCAARGCWWTAPTHLLPYKCSSHVRRWGWWCVWVG